MPPPIRLDAKVEALRTGELLNEFGIKPLLVGELDATLALTARGSDEAALRRTLDGMVALSMGEGRIGSRLIDLTAQDIVGWLFSRGTETRLVCAASVIGFVAGKGTVEGLVLKTDNVQLVGKGTIDLARQTVDLAFAPRPLANRLLRLGTPFTVQGPLDSPSVAVGSAIGLARRAVVETLTLPLNALSAIVPRGAAGVLSTCELER
jgi:uncharacterized protein involved in outer membrane biogenesis